MNHTNQTQQLLTQTDSVFAQVPESIKKRYEKHFYAHSFDVRRTKYKTIFYNQFVELGYSKLEAFVYSEIPSVESSFSNNAVSVCGAKGMWQLMPQTARRFGIHPNQRYDEQLSFIAAERYIRKLKHMAHGDIIKVLYGYNGGPSMMHRKNIAKQSKHFVAKIYSSIQRFEKNKNN